MNSHYAHVSTFTVCIPLIVRGEDDAISVVLPLAVAVGAVTICATAYPCKHLWQTQAMCKDMRHVAAGRLSTRAGGGWSTL